MNRCTRSVLVLLTALALLSVSVAMAEPARGRSDPTIHILLMGAGEHDFGSQKKVPYTLTHILVSLDEAEQRLRFTTLPYNLGVDLQEKGKTRTVQLQQVCSSIGEDAVLGMLWDNFAIRVDYWVTMNFEGLEKAVDALDGLELAVDSLDINRIGNHVKSLLGKAWEKVDRTGIQRLSGLQALGYFLDTMEGNPTVEVEEERFRIKHPAIIRSLIARVRGKGLSAEDLVLTAGALQAHFATNIPREEWDRIARTAVLCLENEPLFLHVPQAIIVTELDNGWLSLFYDETDIDRVQRFVPR